MASKLSKMKFSNNQTLSMNNILNVTLNINLAIPCVTCTTMGSSTSFILISKNFVVYVIMKEFVGHESKRQQTPLSLIIQFTYKKLEISHMALTLALNPLHFSTLGGAFIHPRYLGAIIHQVTMKVTIEALDLCQVSSCLFPTSSFTCDFLLSLVMGLLHFHLFQWP